MYGTIARMRIKPGGMEALQGTMGGSEQPSGAGGFCVFQMDADSNEIYAMAIAESEGAYRAFSESPEANAAYMERLQWIEGEPEWHDGTVIEHAHYDPPNGAKLYGTIAELCVKPGGVEALRMSNGDGEAPDGAVAYFVFQMDADPRELYLVAISESEEAYRASSESAESHRRYLEMMKWMEAEPRWHDGRVLDYQWQAG
jgi:quinol monooxygenase YgiN